MALNEASDRRYATTADVQAAIEQLDLVANHRLYRTAQGFLPGSEYDNPMELLNEAVKRCMQAALGERGRPWPLDVAFEAFLIAVMEGLASDSRSSWYQRNHVEVEALVVEGLSDDDALARHGHGSPAIDEELLTGTERREREAREEAAIARIRSHFAGNLAVSNLIDGKLADLSPAEIREMFDMTLTQYESAQRAYRRGVEKLFSNGGTK